MQNIKHNIIYIFIIAIIFITLWLVTKEKDYIPHGIYLNQQNSVISNTYIKQTNIEDIDMYIIQEINKAKETPIVKNINEKPIGLIRASISYNNTYEIQNAIQKITHKIKSLGSQNGTKTIIGNCITFNKTENVKNIRIYAYTYPSIII